LCLAENLSIASLVLDVKLKNRAP